MDKSELWAEFAQLYEEKTLEDAMIINKYMDGIPLDKLVLLVKTMGSIKGVQSTAVEITLPDYEI